LGLIRPLWLQLRASNQRGLDARCLPIAEISMTERHMGFGPNYPGGTDGRRQV